MNINKKIDLNINSSGNYNEVSDEIIELLKESFDFIKSRDELESFFDKFIELPKINWLSFDSSPVAFNCLIIDYFVFNDSIIKAGKPELDHVSKQFLKFCLDNKIDYNLLDPMKLLHDILLKQAKELKLKFLFTWPNSIAQASYNRFGYSIKNISIETYTRVLNSNYLKKKEIFFLIKFLIKFLNLFFKITSLFIKKLLIEKVNNIEENIYDINKNWLKYCEGNNYILFPHKTNDIINKRFKDNKFEKYLVKHKGSIIGYVILKSKIDDNNIKYLWLVDYFVPDNFLYSLLNSITAANHDALQCRFYSTAHKKINSLLMKLIGYFIKTKQDKKFYYYILDQKLKYDFSKIKIDDFIIDFSM